MELSFSTISHATGALAYLLVSIYIFSRYFRRITDRTLFLATLTTSFWLAILCLQSFTEEIPFYFRYTFELLRNAAWFAVLYALLGIKLLPKKSKKERGNVYLTLFIIALLASMLVMTLYEGLFQERILSAQSLLIFQVAIALVGLLLLEQVWRNASVYRRSGIKYMAVAIASLFGYDFFLYSDALLFQKLSAPLWDTRGAINALAAPFIALTMINSRQQPIGMHVSRQMIFHTTTFVIAGVYLIFLSVGGYYISLFGGTWGEALRVLFIFAGLLLLVLLISSPLLRAKIMVFISKNFFDYKYDYRDEWINSTNALASSTDANPLPLQIIRVLAGLVGSQAGAIWQLNEEKQFTFKGKLELPDQKFDDIDASSDVINFFKEHDWIINLEEYMLDPAKYQLIEIPESMLAQEHPWLIIPLGKTDNIVGLVLLCRPIASIDLNWENYDLLRIVSQQAASYLAQTDFQEKLAEARQFEAVNKTSAFLVHDIKTIIAQLSLLVKNAEKHKTNPAFVDDMIRTTNHTVEKMDHLLQQIHSPNKDETSQHVELGAVLMDVYQSHRNAEPAPSMETPEEEVWIFGDPDQLKSSIGHIVQNAIDATPKNGEVLITTKQAKDHIYLFVQDTGVGMSEDFINNQLFKPFESTKGLTGMGIGVYQSREYLRKIGGSISVTSEENIGTCFTLKLPIDHSPAK